MQDYEPVERALVIRALGEASLSMVEKLQMTNVVGMVGQRAVMILQLVQQIVASDKDDFEIVEDLVCLFETYGLDADATHDFG